MYIKLPNFIYQSSLVLCGILSLWTMNCQPSSAMSLTKSFSESGPLNFSGYFEWDLSTTREYGVLRDQHWRISLFHVPTAIVLSFTHLVAPHPGENPNNGPARLRIINPADETILDESILQISASGPSRRIVRLGNHSRFTIPDIGFRHGPEDYDSYGITNISSRRGGRVRISFSGIHGSIDALPGTLFPNIPEPATFLGSVTVLGFMFLLKKKQNTSQ